ncbi:hypothetical protein PC114_g12939 [Phytophthora cactorum]|uniref:FAD/NAD(P)-binding domain-containing protein n=1 Tax=Phytophthora cactorum TaxID=29920 RepID=A0A8T1C2U6_9STRA|nr:hypothetical protein PC114_g12939 [Phytophthora cactorum]KAG2915907.1 hypothetical protein PC115_g11247 [Phytophthora cactorum]KAG3016583.1 hypothetical protein PC120_g11505 [Phytophthora cactorum]KAG3080978.1 hypothetical protein PC122_g11513 [Phytophthora cactorum]
MTRIIIVGGGPAGISVAQALAKNVTTNDVTEVIVFEKSKYYYHSVGTPRAVVDADYTKKLVVPYDNAIAAEARTYTVPLKQPKNNIKRSTTEKMMAELHQQIGNVNSILIVGGGATGAGVAGEIKPKFSNKTVTIIEGKDKLLSTDNVREKFRSRFLKFLEASGRERRVGELVSDIQLLCGGFSPTTELIKNLDAGLVTPQGLIKVNSKLQLDDARYSNIYALGDANNNSAPKHMLFASLQGTHLGNELTLVARKTQENVRKNFPKVEVVPAMVRLGPNGGVSQLPFFGGVLYRNFVTRTFKSKEYFASFAWKNLNAEVPN